MCLLLHRLHGLVYLTDRRLLLLPMQADTVTMLFFRRSMRALQRFRRARMVRIACIALIWVRRDCGTLTMHFSHATG